MQNEELELEFVWSTYELDQHLDSERGTAERSEKNVSATDQVKNFMRREGLTNPAFAKLTGKSQRTVGSVLAGVPVGKETRVAVAKALEATPEELFRE